MLIKKPTNTANDLIEQTGVYNALGDSVAGLSTWQRGLSQLKNIFLMMLLVPLSFATHATNVNAQMSISPEQCIAMSQGQSCYVALELSWQVDLPGDYCLYSSAQKGALRCWTNTTTGQFNKAFNTQVNLNFYLKKQHQIEPLVTSVVKMAWVHKKKGQPRTSWRLF